MTKNLIIYIFCIVPFVARAETASDYFVNAFVGGCVQTMPDIEKVEAASRALNWKKLEGDKAKLLGPQEESKDAKMWLVNRDNALPYMIGINKADFKGQKVAICTASDPYVSADDVIISLKKLLNLTQPNVVSEEAGQRLQGWSKTVHELDNYITATDATPMKQSGITLGIMTPIIPVH